MKGKTRKQKVYWPPKYYRGLTRGAQTKRKTEIKKYGAMNWKDPKAYVGFQTNKGRKTRKSSYTATWNKMFPTIKSLKDRAAITGVPEDLLRKCYNRGMAAWRTGHRPGATQQQWGYARVSSLLLMGKTAKTTDSDLVREAKERSAKAKAWFSRMEKEALF